MVRRLLLMSFVPAYAATVAAREPIEEIIVTARGRTETLIAVPDSVAVFDRNALAARQVINFEDIAAATPGVFVINDQDPGTNIITVRGVSTDRLQQASVAYVVDGLALADKELFTQPYYDLERIEILKGPQGALYGKNAIGGVFNLATRAPTETPEATAELEAGNGDNIAVRAAAGGPLAGSKVRFRLAAQYQDWDGWIYNSFLKKNVDFQTTRNARLRVAVDASDDVALEVRWNVNDEDSGAAWLSSNNVTGRFGGRLDGAALTDPFGDFEGVAKRHWWEASAKADVKVGGGVWSSIVGFDHYAKRWTEELDFRNDKPITFFGQPFFPNGIQPIAQPVDLEFWTAETRFTSSDDAAVRWIAGAFFQDTRRLRVDDFGPLLFGAEASQFKTPVEQVAGFGQATMSPIASWDITAALRFDSVKTSEDVRGVRTGSRIDLSRKTFKQLQPKLSVAYRPDNLTTVYASAGRGFKPGGFNPTPRPGETFTRIYKAETTTALELGAKGRTSDGALTYSAAAFATDYRNFQYFAFINGNDTTFTAPKVKIKGVEGSMTIAPVEAFSADVALAYTDAKVGTFRAPDPVTGIGLRTYTGNQTPNSPRFNGLAGLSATLPMGDSVTATLRGELTVRGRTYFEIDNALFSPTETSINLRAALTFGDWSIAAWAKNVTDNRWAVSAFGQGQIGLLAFLGPNGPFDSFNINRGRQIGVTVKAEY